jgi:mycothiol system anti-sigma-R factor
MSFFDRLRRIFGGRAADGHVHDGVAGDHGHISCDEALHLVYEYLDGELEDVSQERVRAHFEVCAMCYPHLRFEKSFRAAVARASQGETAPAELKAHLLELLERAGTES